MATNWPQKVKSVTLGLMLTNCCLKLHSRKHLQQLAENAAYSIHGGSLASVIWLLGRTKFTLAELSLLPHSTIFSHQKRNWG